jgi:hypothetical protein
MPTIQSVEPPRLIAWTGMMFVRTEESDGGLVARLLREPIQKELDQGLDDGFRSLRAEAERNTTR